MIQDKKRFSFDNVLIESGLINDRRKFIKLEEEGKMKVADKVTAKLLNGIYKKFNNSYFSYIEASRGDITKLKDYKDINDCINFLYKLINGNKNIRPYIKNCIAIIKESVTILKLNKNNFVNSFNNKNSTVTRYLYDGVVAAIIEGLTGIISNYIAFQSINFSKFQVVVKDSNKDISGNNFFSSMKKFIDLHTNNKLIELFNFENKRLNEDIFTGLTVLGIGIAVIITALLLARTIVYAVYFIRIKIAEKLDEVRNLLILNSTTLSQDSNNKEIIEKQKQWIEKLEKKIDKFDVDHAVAQSKANNEINNENKEISSQDTNYDSDVIM
jgi:hypothetical protein